MEHRPHNPIEIETLRQQIARLEQPRHDEDAVAVASGCTALDRLLPEGGFRPGILVEWLADGEAAGAETLAMATARQACRGGGTLVVLDVRREFYPPAAVRLGIEPKRLIVVQVSGKADHHWALDQSLRCPGVAAVLAWPDGPQRPFALSLPPSVHAAGQADKRSERRAEGSFDGRTFRRMQLAVEEGGGLGLLIRPDSVRHEPSWAEVRLLIEPLPAADGRPCRRRIQLLRCRGTADGRHVDVELDDETRAMHLAAQLAHPTTAGRAAGA